MIFYRKIYTFYKDDSIFHDTFDNPSKYDGYVCFVEIKNGKEEIKRYHFNRKLHRKDKPALEYMNEEDQYYNCWWYMGKRHREDGPARLVDNEYYFHGEKIVAHNNEEFEEKIKLLIRLKKLNVFK